MSIDECPFFIVKNLTAGEVHFNFHCLPRNDLGAILGAVASVFGVCLDQFLFHWCKSKTNIDMSNYPTKYRIFFGFFFLVIFHLYTYLKSRGNAGEARDVGDVDIEMANRSEHTPSRLDTAPTVEPGEVCVDSEVEVDSCVVQELGDEEGTYYTPPQGPSSMA